jgi:hypothetical protein
MQRKTGEENIMDQETPYDHDLTFISHDGQQMIEGKSFYPVLLRLNIERYEMMRIMEELWSAIKADDQQTTIALSGTLNPTEY